MNPDTINLRDIKKMRLGRHLVTGSIGGNEWIKYKNYSKN
jgi:hypothetical protein